MSTNQEGVGSQASSHISNLVNIAMRREQASLLETVGWSLLAGVAKVLCWLTVKKFYIAGLHLELRNIAQEETEQVF